MNLLQKGDKIRIIAPARRIALDELQTSIYLLRECGYRVDLGKHTLGAYHQFSGTDAERASDLQDAIDDDSVSAIWCARGGYGGLRIIDRIDFTKFKQNPKWICGYSDTTALHALINNSLNLPSLHCTMPLNIQNQEEIDAPTLSGTSKNSIRHCGLDPQSPDDKVACHLVKTKEMLKQVQHDGLIFRSSLSTMLYALENGKLTHEISPNPLNRVGEAEGKLVGGNLSILYAINGSFSDIKTENAILFIEDVDEYLYHIDRMMLCLKRCGKLERLTGLIVGGMSDMHDNVVSFGKNAEEIVYEHVAEYNFPVCFGFPAGHIQNNQALFLGGNITLKIDSQRVYIQNSI